MRIAYVSTDPGIPVFGCKGASIHVQEMVRAFLAKDAEVTLFSPRLSDTPPDDLAQVKLHQLPPAPKGNVDERARKQLAANRYVTQALEEDGPFDLIYERHALFAHAAMEFAQDNKIASVLEVNAPLIDEQARHRALARIDDAILSACQAFHAAQQIVAVSQEVAEYAESLGAAKDKINVEPNAVNPNRFMQIAPITGRFCVGFLGTLKPWHDVALVVEAFALLKKLVPDAELLIVGDGPERPNLVLQAEAAGVLDDIHFTGMVTAEDVPRWLCKMHVGLATYRSDAPFYFSPLKLYEYMAAGLPSVVSQVGKLPNAIDEGKTGRSVPPDDAEALAAVLAQLASNPDHARQMGQTARDRVLSQQTWDHVAGRVLYRAATVQKIKQRAG